jgi:hypothetical protein
MLNRREFLKLGSALLAGGLASQKPLAVQAEPLEAPTYQGPNLAGWKVRLGDALYPPDGVQDSDIATKHFPEYSEVRANINRRVIMAHNITYKLIIDPNAFNYIHTCSVSFRLPYLPAQNPSATLNGQTVEGGIFIWDGPNTNPFDYGMAFQWLVNPWGDGKGPSGSLRIWNGKAWVRVGQLAVDTNWHSLKMVVDFKRKSTLLLIDNRVFLSRFSKTSKIGFGNTVDARFQLEAISIDPRPANTIKAMHRVQYKNWKWLWETASC